MNIIFFDEYVTSQRNGIGTFRNTLLSGIHQFAGINPILISLNYPTSEIKISTKDNLHTICFPPINTGDWNYYGGIICPLLHFYIEDSSQNIFILNVSPCSKFISALKNSFPLSKVIFIIHDQGWCSTLYGNSEYFVDIVQQRNNDLINEQLRKDIINYCEEEKMIYGNCDAVVAVSPATAIILQKYYNVPRNKITCIPHGISFNSPVNTSKEALRKKYGIPKSDIVVIYSGRPSRYKGLIPLLKAINIVKSYYSNIKCVFCCSHKGIDEFQEYISPIAAHCTFTGHIPTLELCEWYQLSDMGILPSYSEQFGYSAIEMIVNQLPVIVSNGYGLKDLFVPNQTAVVANINDVLDTDEFALQLANSIKYVIEAPEEKINGIKTNAFNFVREELSLERMISDYLKLFNNLLNDNV